MSEHISITPPGEEKLLTIANVEHMNSETLNANLRPIISALDPQNNAPISSPIYNAIVRPLF
jgi:hypothetical protein